MVRAGSGGVITGTTKESSKNALIVSNIRVMALIVNKVKKWCNDKGGKNSVIAFNLVYQQDKALINALPSINGTPIGIFDKCTAKSFVLYGL